MKKSQIMLLVMAAFVLITGCGKTSYKKTAGGMPYKLYRSKDTQQVKPGDYVKMSMITKVNDSVLFTSVNGLPFFQMVSNQTRPYDISELLPTLHVGDSVVATQMVDTFIKRSPQSVPPQFRNGDKLTMYFKILAVYPNDSLARIAFEAESKAFTDAEVAFIQKYVSDKKINAVKTKSGAFVEVIKQGEGPVADSGKYVSVKYTGTSWTGEKFDSNVDTAFGHTEPYSFTLGMEQSVKGFEEGVMALSKGGKAKVYIPSMLGYGPNGKAPKIKPYEHLIFELELIDIRDKAPQSPMPMMPPQNIDVPQPKNN